MTYPLIIAFEMSGDSDDAFPLAIAWSLPEGSIKSTLIQPEDEWLEETDDRYLDIDTDHLYQQGHSAKAVLEELQLDREQEPLYAPGYYTAERGLEKLYATVEGDNDLPLRPLQELLVDHSPDEVEALLQESRLLLDLDPYTAEGQVRLWLEVYARLQ
ncbi:hypothetical protein [Motiliproteus sediminis]|uniref:hypothetical protein n=1 Tax=Motiliproteus sediminis TaxID=1468178 RepID=UPI001AEF74F5|nr:hypothetical protein [Motiliproteus sediminis]